MLTEREKEVMSQLSTSVAASLQEMHRNIVAMHKFELSVLQNEIASLKKRLADALIP